MSVKIPNITRMHSSMDAYHPRINRINHTSGSSALPSSAVGVGGGGGGGEGLADGGVVRMCLTGGGSGWSLSH